MATADQNLTYLIWMLLAVSLVVTWHSQQTKMKIITLQKNILKQQINMEPLSKEQENRKSMNEKRWNNVMNAMQAFSRKYNKTQFLDPLKAQIKQSMLKSGSNATTLARELLPKAEELVIAQQLKKGSGAGVERLMEDMRQGIKNIVRQSLDNGYFLIAKLVLVFTKFPSFRSNAVFSLQHQ